MNLYKIFTSLSCMVVFTVSVQAQIVKSFAPVYADIKKVISDNQSDNHYPKLLKRFLEMDSTLTEEQYYVIYYGQCLQDNYNPLSKGNESIQKLAQKVTAENYTDFKTAYLKTKDQYPLDLRSLQNAYILAYKFQDDAFVRKLQVPLIGLIKVIASSGDGKSPDQGFHIMNESDEYVFCNLLNLHILEKSQVGEFDFIQLSKNERFGKIIYFINRPQLSNKSPVILEEFVDD
ncbi:DUF4919 domain-containing protein [Sphingobacterium sp. SRCM116780]|uniref:DUF4919 domain-containing protein n=1 Tax=Sphingobacterium sp. SRCM116780 TaxID=2907623 RepID=UPI001F1769DF|nr:DUF4919 domain-containing protein [Sphingobacterium sp. SRCM116780]UIR55035.1 DUF4919 domain-containing protein [Sphingobacterium sp. SRCM116780]